jgi:hypothetical protein
MLFYVGYISFDSNPKLFSRRIRWPCKMFLILVGKLLWPIVHFVRRVIYEASPKRSQHQDVVAKSDAVWNNIKFVEYGLESSIQLFLQLWLLHPFLPTIAAWDMTELVNRYISGLTNFFTFELHPACYVEKVLIKIALSVFSLSLGMSQMMRKPGQSVLSTLPMFVSLVAQTIGRIFAFKSLVLMSTPLGYYKYVLFLLFHIMLVLIIKTLFEVHSLKDPHQ